MQDMRVNGKLYASGDSLFLIGLSAKILVRDAANKSGLMVHSTRDGFKIIRPMEEVDLFTQMAMFITASG